MDDSISRQEVLDAIDEISNEVADGYGFDYAKWREYFCELPPTEPKRMRGKWIPITNGRIGHECDQCHEYAPSYESGNEYLSRFCPYCGVKMEETING